MGNFSSRASTAQNRLRMGKYGTKLDYCSSEEASCIGQPSVHSLSAVLELTLGRLRSPPVASSRLQSPPILLPPYFNTNFSAAMKTYLSASSRLQSPPVASSRLRSPPILLPPYLVILFHSCREISVGIWLQQNRRRLEVTGGDRRRPEAT